MKKKLIELLLQNRDPIVKRWERQILKTIPVYKGKPISQLRKDIKAVFDSLVMFLKVGSSRKLSGSLREMANIRLSERFSVGEVLKAILVGKVAIINIVLGQADKSSNALPYCLCIDEFFHESVTQFAEIFQEMRQELAYLKNIVGKEFQFDNIIGKSKQMKDIFALLPRIADSAATILIIGKSGTGKELIAKAIHFHSPRRNKSYVAINCSALPETLLESEMFGYVKGAFTGATHDKDGLFREAEGGTVFLDEIGDMSLALQAKLLRVLQEKEYKKVGGTKTQNADVRVITATNKDLKREIANGNFREDFFYRINVISIHLPELRERKEDIPILIERFIAKFSRESGRNVKSISKATLKTLIDYKWPGNVRELENTIERAVILCRGTEIKHKDLSLTILGDHRAEENAIDKHDKIEAPPPRLAELEKQRIIDALIKTGFNRSKAAEKLGINRKTLYRKMKRFDLS